MFKKTSAFIKGTWDGTPDESNFTQSEEEYSSPDDFVDYSCLDTKNISRDYTDSGVLISTTKTMSADGKVMISTKEYLDEASWNIYRQDERWAAENAVTKKYDVEIAPTPEQVGTFNEEERVYYHSVAHLK